MKTIKSLLSIVLLTITIFFFYSCKKDSQVVGNPNQNPIIGANFSDSIGTFINQMQNSYTGNVRTQTITMQCSSGIYPASDSTYSDNLSFSSIASDSIVPNYSNVTAPMNATLILTEIDSVNRMLTYTHNGLNGCMYNNRKILRYYINQDSVSYIQKGKAPCAVDPNDYILPCSDGYIKTFNSN